MQQHNGSKVHPRLGRRRTLSGWNEVYEPAILWGGGSAGCPGLRPRNGRAVQQPSGLHRHGVRTRWAADVAERTEDAGPSPMCAPRRTYLGDRRVSRDLTGRAGAGTAVDGPQLPADPVATMGRLT